MLAELFMLRLEAIARNTNQQGTTSSDTRFVPVKLPATKPSGSTKTA
jgi:hypothetical protein